MIQAAQSGREALEQIPEGNLDVISLAYEEFGDATWEGELDVEAAAEEIVAGHAPAVAGGYAAWTFGSLGLVLLLAIQVLWFNRNGLSQVAGVRGYYEAACRVLGCDLPVYSDIGALHATHLVVRTDPTVAGALAVDAIIRNDAPFRQYFPDLELHFSDIHGKPVAARSFVPAEYLGGEMAGLKFIPAKTEVRISLEIVDPGPSATNYLLIVRQ